ncbi:hypothetical protein PENTCL1PPCAC_419 [Pristionchus entomophagus]|uniref:Uncharacterized protein n=1 Tax=Pristionchus entomophagus TaxID=358040 RepID=A0AAV5S7E3_9BILA|nr:hypothetical protein PENTCL1PPCAC_419 [Pristionchus entomophagus]
MANRHPTLLNSYTLLFPWPANDDTIELNYQGHMGRSQCPLTLLGQTWLLSIPILANSRRLHQMGARLSSSLRTMKTSSWRRRLGGVSGYCSSFWRRVL